MIRDRFRRYFIGNPIPYFYGLREYETFHVLLEHLQNNIDGHIGTLDFQYVSEYLEYRKQLYTLPLCKFDCSLCERYFSEEVSDEEVGPFSSESTAESEETSEEDEEEIQPCPFTGTREERLDAFQRALFPSNDTYISLDLPSFYLMMAIAYQSKELRRWILKKETHVFLLRQNLYAHVPQLALYQRYLEQTLLRGWIRFPNNHQQLPDDFYPRETAEMKNEIYRQTVTTENPERSYFKNNILIHWSWLSSKAFKWKEIRMHRGWIAIPKHFYQYNPSQYIGFVIQRMFEKGVENLGENLSPQELTEVRAITEQQLQQEIIKHTPYEYTTDIPVMDVIKHSASCVHQLDHRWSSIGIDSYDDILQLSLYLKHFLEFEDLCRYFWKRGVMNQHYPSLNAYMSSQLTYIEHIRHQYGQTGGGTNYDPMSCKTAQIRGFCFYQQPIATITTHLKQRYQALRRINERFFEQCLHVILKYVRVCC